jgi:5'(3')-deoxyribonucleotidase
MIYLGVDVDGVIARYVEGLRATVAKARGLTPDEILTLLGIPTDYGFSNWIPINGEFVKLHTDGVDDGMYRNLLVFDDASKYLWMLSDEGIEIGIITSRFVKHRQNKVVVQDTAEWLDSADIPYRDISFLRDKTRFIADIYIDDAPHNIEAYQKAGRYVIIFDAPYNQHVEGDRAYNWKDVYDLIQKFKKAHPELV